MMLFRRAAVELLIHKKSLPDIAAPTICGAVVLMKREMMWQILRSALGFGKLLGLMRICSPMWVATFLTWFMAITVLADPVDWPTLGFTQVGAGGFNHPVGIARAGDGSGRLFVIEQPGRIWIIQNGNNLANPFLDLSSRVLSTGPEQGLLGLAFPSAFSTNHHFYVDYTRQPDGAVVISRFSLSSTNANVADSQSEQIVLVIPKPYDNHNGGQLAFGPEGALYIGVGDGGSEGDPLNNGQKTSTLLGKLLRIDVESGAVPYAVPTSNPFVGNTNFAPEIWAWGLRNPWRFSFDRRTGDLYVADVGQNQFEEIDFQPAGSAGGQNYGWRIMEGPANYIVPSGFTNFSALTPPVAWYDHFSLPTDLSAAVVGGYVYRGPSQPRMDGMYFYGDFEAGWIWGLKQTGTNWQSLVLVRPGLGLAPRFAISSFGEDDQGQLYLADYASGSIFRVNDSGMVWTPTFSPAGGTINSNLVTVSCLTTGAVIHYTTNIFDPTLSDPGVPSGATITVGNGNICKIRAFRSDLSPSGIATTNFVLAVGTPFFTPPAGAIASNAEISISCVTPGAFIYYTTDGTIPTTNSSIYSSLLTFNGDAMTINAFGVAAGYNNSLVGTASYSAAQAATPVFMPASGPITNGTFVSLSCVTPGAVIYYTLDGSAPSTNSSIYTAPLAINGGTTVSAFAVASNYLSSSVQSILYQLVQTATPTFSPASGPLSYGTALSISCATPGSAIYYTLDGTTPTTNSSPYSVPLAVYSDTTLSAFATAPQHLDSSVQSAAYTLIKAATPSFSPAQGPLTNGAFISISTATSNATIRFTVDGSVPDTNSALYSGPLLFTNLMTLTARAWRSDLDPSNPSSVFYGLIDFESTIVTTLAGGGSSGLSNAVGSLATFSSPQGICIDRTGNLYVADTGNNVVRKISPAGQVTTFAGNGTAGSQLGAATNAQFSGPTGVAIDTFGNVFVADANNNRICKVDTNGMVTRLTNLSPLSQLEVDASGNVYAGSWASIQEVFPNGTVIQVAGTHINSIYYWGAYVGLGLDAGTNIYATTLNHIWETAPDGTTTLFAGNNAGYSDGPRALSLFQSPQDATVDAGTNLFVSESTRIRKIRADGWVSTFAGTSISGQANGPGRVAQFNGAVGLCVDTNGNVYVADSGNNCIREISPDSAGIGIPDWWQIRYFGYMGIDPNADPDDDGMSNIAEFWAGTDPTDPASVFKVVDVTLNGAGTRISWNSVLGKSYIVQYSSNLISWNTLGSPIPGNGSVVSFTDPASVQQTGRRFYWISIPH
jgi:glucose/arabinose dehydrogenase/sugar lactone lactonase YvrE